jgi:hypothetical protein
MKRKRKNRKRWNKKNLKEKSKELGEKIEENLKDNVGASIEERWKGLKETIINSAKDIIGTEESAQARKPWVTGEMLMEMEERRKWKHQSTEEAKKEYRRLNNKLRRTTEEAREKWWEEQCREIEELQQKRMDSMVYNKVKNLSRKTGKGGGIEIRDKNGRILSQIGEVKDRWKEYIEELYKDENSSGEGEDVIREMEEQTGEANEDIGPELLAEEVRAAIKELKNNKTEGYDDIPAEMLKSLDEKAMKELIKICQEIYTSGIWPEDYLQSIMVPIQKKPNATRCEDHRTISLITHASKILIRILTKRIQAKTDAIHEIGDDQFGFRKGMGTRDAIGSLRVITERSCEIGKDVYICFVDYEKAFDRVDWRKLMRALRRVGVDWRDRRLIGNLYMGQKVRIRIDGEYSEQAKVGRGVRQGCPLSPLLFNIYIEEIIKEALEDLEEGIKVGGMWIRALRFADDQAMMAGSQEGLQTMMDRLNTTSKEYGMRINKKKTKVMRISKGEQKIVKINIDGEELEQVKEFAYLGSTITEDARCHREIKRRIVLGKDAFEKRNELLSINQDLQSWLLPTRPQVANSGTTSRYRG